MVNGNIMKFCELN